MLLDPGLSVHAFWEIQLHRCLKYKSLRGHIKMLHYLYHSGNQSQPFFKLGSGFSGFPLSSNLVVNLGTQYLIGVEEGYVGSETTYFLKAKR